MTTKRWEHNDDGISMSLWEGENLWARIQHRVGRNNLTGEYYLVPDTFDVSFHKAFLNGVGLEFDENLRELVPMTFTSFKSVEESVAFVDDFIKYPFPVNIEGLMSELITEYFEKSPKTPVCYL